MTPFSKQHGSFRFLFLILLLVGVVWQRLLANAGSWQTKVAPSVLATISDHETEFILFLTQQADLQEAASLMTKEARGMYVYAMLSAVAEREQRPLISLLQEAKVAYRPFWIANMIWVRGDLALLQKLAQMPAVAYVYANPHLMLPQPPVSQPLELSVPAEIEWNIERVQVPLVWSAGILGQNVIIGAQDTGYDWQHPALQNQYRGWTGSTANHNYNWHDAIHSGGGVCQADSPEPCDDNNHGTHTLGTMVGDDGNGNQIGMAPAAQWIGCRNMDQGIGTPITYSECFQWFVAPTDLNDQNPNPSQAPHVINNSWSCPTSEGCGDVTILQTVVENVRAAGIVVVASAGNSGPSCATINQPPAIYDASFTVGATNTLDQITSFSSRGPATINELTLIKPDVVAPGQNIRSALPGGSYGTKQGTSMASPHVVGLVALLISANPSLAGQVERIEQIIRQTAVPIENSQVCDTPANQIPNNVFGYGLIQAWNAYQLAITPQQNSFLPFLYTP